MNLPEDIKKNTVIETEIYSLGSNGEGVGRTGELAVFVPGALIGEHVRGIVIKTAKNYAVLKLTDILVPSPERVKPNCPVYKRCGGCTLQHMSYTAQLEFKRNRIQECLLRIGKIEFAVPPVVGMQSPWRYRNKCAFPISGKNGFAVGMYSAKSHTVIETEDCAIQPPECSAAIRALRIWAIKNNIKPYDEEKNTGSLRHIVLRKAQSGEVLIAIVTRTPLPFCDELVSLLIEAVPGTKGIIENINPQKTNVILGQKERVLYGSPTVCEEIMGLSFEVSLQSFLQVNPTQTQKLYEKVLSLAHLSGTETVIDAYCGIGTITLMLAKKAKKIIGIEIVPSAIADAKKNARRNGIDNAEFIEGLSEEELPKLINSGIIPDLLVLDPPRKGCDKKLIDVITASDIPQIIYVSCDPATLARDLALLLPTGYKIKEVHGHDMFPQTAHVETVVLMSRVEK